MRTNIVIDDDLMKAAVQASGARNKREAVEMGLKTLIRLHDQAGLRNLRGKLEWAGDLDTLRQDR